MTHILSKTISPCPPQEYIYVGIRGYLAYEGKAILGPFKAKQGLKSSF